MALDHVLKPGDRLVMTTLPDGFIHQVETRAGAIKAGAQLRGHGSPDPGRGLPALTLGLDGIRPDRRTGFAGAADHPPPLPDTPPDLPRWRPFAADRGVRG